MKKERKQLRMNSSKKIDDYKSVKVCGSQMQATCYDAISRTGINFEYCFWVVHGFERTNYDLMRWVSTNWIII